MEHVIREIQSWAIYPMLRGAMVVGAALTIGLLTHVLAFRLALKVATRTKTRIDDLIGTHCRAPSRLLFPLIALNLVLPLLALLPRFARVIKHLVSLGMVIGITWLLIRLTHVFVAAVLARYDLAAEDNLVSRKVHTQLKVLQRIAVVVLVIVSGATALMTFERVRQLGTSILASAGIAGIVLGLAAQKTLANVIAGVQIAISQPIRIDDVVIVENEWGRIEEITFTYVVVRIWDQRRLVVPISYFVEKPFQNWTRTSSDILGTVFLQVDHTVPIDAVRDELTRVCKASSLWDGKVCLVQVTNTADKTIELRALVSAKDAGKAWDLRCEVREKLVDFIRRQHPDALPRLRATLEPISVNAPSAGSAGA
jgi:small-conductance mechanosensitive channel